MINCNHPDKFITQNKCDCLEYNIGLEGRLTLYIIFIIAIVKLRPVVVKRHSTLKNVIETKIISKTSFYSKSCPQSPQRVMKTVGNYQQASVLLRLALSISKYKNIEV